MIEPLGWESLGGFLEEVTVDQEKERVDRVFRQGEQWVGRDLYSLCLVIRSCLFGTSWSIVHQAPLSMGFSRQEYWSG